MLQHYIQKVVEKGFMEFEIVDIPIKPFVIKLKFADETHYLYNEGGGIRKSKVTIFNTHEEAVSFARINSLATMDGLLQCQIKQISADDFDEKGFERR